MPRNKPTAKLDVIGNLDLNPEEAVGDFIESQQQEKYFIKAPNWDTPGDSIELLTIENEREYNEMKKIQAEMLENARKQKIINSKRIKDMYQIAKDLRDRFISVNTFLKDCKDKEKVAEKKIQQEKSTQSELRRDIIKYKKDIKELEAFKEVLTKTVNEMIPYEELIHEVVAKSDIMSSEKDCMARVDGILLAHDEINDLESKKVREIEIMRTNMIKSTNEAALILLGFNNELAELERSYNKVKDECQKWEKVITATKDFIVGTELTTSRVLDALHILYVMLCHRREMEPELHRLQVEETFDFIRSEIEILQEVLKVCRKELEEDERVKHINEVLFI